MDGKRFRYFYDINGLSSAKYSANNGGSWNYYSYVRDAQQNIIGLVHDYELRVRYEYDCFGKIVKVFAVSGGTLKDITNDQSTFDSNFGHLNPFRWKSHYFDNDSGLYYIGGRFYDPETALFVNATDMSVVAQNSLSANMLDRNGIMCDNVVALTRNYANIRNKSIWETIFWLKMMKALADFFAPLSNAFSILDNTIRNGGLSYGVGVNDLYKKQVSDYQKVSAVFAGVTFLDGASLVKAETGIYKTEIISSKLFNSNTNALLEVGALYADVSLGLGGSVKIVAMSGEVGLQVGNDFKATGSVYIGFGATADFSKGVNLGIGIGIGLEFNFEFSWYGFANWLIGK